jgi:hypothetical protein
MDRFILSEYTMQQKTIYELQKLSNAQHNNYLILRPKHFFQDSKLFLVNCNVSQFLLAHLSLIPDNIKMKDAYHKSVVPHNVTFSHFPILSKQALQL